MINLYTNILLKSVLDSLSVHIAVLDNNGIIKYVNQAWEEFAVNNGLDIEKCGIGVNYLETIQSSKVIEEEKTQIEEAVAGITNVIAGTKELFVFDYFCNTCQGLQWFQMKVTPFIGKGDCQVVVAHENISKRKKQEQELDEIRYFNERVLANLEEVIMYLDPDMNLRWANKVAQKYYSLNLAEMREEFGYDKYNLEDYCPKCPVFKVRKSKQREEAIIEKPDGSVWKTKAIPDLDRKGKLRGIIEVSLDISKRKKVEKQMKQVVNKLEEQFEKAGQLHDQFLPNKMPQITGLNLGTYYAPADRLGGDFYNFIELDDRLVFYVSDVSGHDLSGSMLNIFLKETINSYLIANHQNEEEITPAKILDFINNHFSEEEFPADYFICLIIGIIDITTKEVEFANAGIQFSPVLIKEGKEVITFSCGGLPISYISSELGFVYEGEKFGLEEGDIFFLYTDGLIEQSKQGERYGEERLHNILEENKDSKPTDTIEKISLDFNNFRAELPMQDDITYMLIQHDNSLVK